MIVLLPLLLSLAAGFSILCAVWPGPRPVKADLLAKLCLAVGLGLGLSSCGFFLALVAVGPSRTAVLVADIALMSGSVGLLAWRLRWEERPRAAARPVAPVDPPTEPPWPLGGILWITLVAALFTFALRAQLLPHGEWDAWAIWNLRARFLARAAEGWREAFSGALQWSHVDYPLLLPGSVARLWIYAGTETVLAPMLVALPFTFATAGLVFTAISRARGTTQGVLGALVILGTPAFTRLGTAQLADVPLAHLFLSALVLFCRYETTLRAPRGLACLGGVLLGLAAWAKNEGLLFVAAVLLARAAVARPWRGWSAARREASWVLLGLAPILTILLFFKVGVAPPTEYTQALTLSWIQDRLLDPARYTRIATAVGQELLRFGGWEISAVAVLTVYALIAGIRVAGDDRGAVAMTGIALGLMAAGYVGVYLLSPYDLDWHLGTSLPRLFLHLWPSAVFLYWLVVKRPDPATKGPGRANSAEGSEMAERPGFEPGTGLITR